jgi:hypothetical protein
MSLMNLCDSTAEVPMGTFTLVYRHKTWGTVSLVTLARKRATILGRMKLPHNRCGNINGTKPPSSFTELGLSHSVPNYTVSRINRTKKMQF